MPQHEDPKVPSWIHEEEAQHLEEVETRKRIGRNMLDFVMEVDVEGYDSLVFLDKSARPAAWLFMDMWRRMFPHRRQKAIHLVNIGMEKDKNFNSLNASDKLREIFTVGTGERDVNGKRVLADRTYFDGKSVCIVDEFSVSGASLALAKLLFEQAFEGKFVGEIHTNSLFPIDPPWYTVKDSESTRREEMLGIIDLDPNSLQVRPFPSVANIWLRGKIAQIAKETVGDR